MTPDARRADAVRSHLQQIEGSPEERRRRQMEHLRRVRQVLERDFAVVPLWWAELRAEVKKDLL